MSDWPLVSLVTPVLNGAELIQRTIDSIRQQDYPHIEHVVMDGGSTDGTLDILRANEAWLKWYSEPDKGQSDAINRGFAHTTGKYLNWLNADDFLYPGAVRRCVEEFKANPRLGIVYGQLALVNKDGSLRRMDHSIREGSYEELLHWDNIIGQPGLLFSREAWEVCGPLSLEDHYAMDWDLWIKIGSRFPFKYIPVTLAALSVYETTKSVSGGLKRYEEIIRMLERNGSRAPLEYYKAGRECYWQNDMRQARRYFLIALRRQPKPYLRRELIWLIARTYLGRVRPLWRKLAGRANLEST